jgi:cellulose synthase/poly-beta-1,6-N-acetylglucosamine synthase-like glycosyltransferase
MNEKKCNSQCPMVSIIVPVRNGEKTIEKLLAALLMQDYPRDKMQIIIVDNGSQDKTSEIIRKFPVILAEENKIHSSYAARNKGLSIAKGEIIAFTDADCIPARNWISEGVRALIEQNADMAGGKISFLLSARLSAAELIDSVTFLQNEQYIKNNRAAVTANLFIRKELFSKVGLFREIQFGGDTHWTQKATQSGVSLIYAKRAIVDHPARNLRGLLEKSRRVFLQMLNISRQSKDYFKIFFIVIRQLIPIPSRNILKLFIARRANIIKCLFSVWGVSYLLQINGLAGLLLLVFKMRKN